MKKDCYLLSFAASGIKNIEKRIELEFYKKTIDKSFDPEKYRVKAIYGENGSGKTALITSVQIMKDLIINEDYLTNPTKQAELLNLVNKHTNRIDMCMDFIKLYAQDIDEHSIVYRYEIVIAPGSSGRFEIKKEVLLARNGEYATSQFKTLYECREGTILSADLSEEAFQTISKQSLNLLSQKTLAGICVRKITDNINMTGATDFYRGVLDLLFIAVNTYVSLEQSDQHEAYFINKEYELAKSNNDFEEAYKNMLKQMDLMVKNGRKLVYRMLFDNYCEEVKKLTSFLKLFKPELVSIDIDQKDYGDYYETSLIMNYGDYTIDTEFESTGIKKLIKLFNYLNYAVSGGIVFIDEMDSNINDIYLAKLIEYVMEYGKGQLCFTTHNTSPMSVLRKNKKSIDFMSSDNKIIGWRTNGNFAPESLYRQGMIEYLPFNIEPEDFLGILEG